MEQSRKEKRRLEEGGWVVGKRVSYGEKPTALCGCVAHMAIEL